MDNTKRKQHKHAFEIKAFADGWGILYWSEANEMWHKVMYAPDVDTKKYVVNDALVEYRKAEKEGKQIERLNEHEKWEPCIMSNIPPTNTVKNKYRVKSEYKVGDKVITKGYSWKYDGKVLTINKISRGEYCYFNESENRNDNFVVYKIQRFATNKEIRAVNKPKIGDVCLFWNERSYAIAELTYIGSGMLKYRSKISIIWFPNCIPIDTNKSVDEILKLMK